MLTLLHLAVMTANLCGPGGVRAVIAENLLLKRQLLVLRRARQTAPHVPRLGCDDAAWTDHSRHFSQARGRVGNEEITSGMTATSNESSGKGLRLASP